MEEVIYVNASRWLNEVINKEKSVPELLTNLNSLLDIGHANPSTGEPETQEQPNPQKANPTQLVASSGLPPVLGIGVSQCQREEV